MKVVLLAGGLGTRISEESYLKPKPMIEIGGKPILWHIMKLYSAYGLTEFIVCAGYKGYVIKEYFANYFLQNSDVTFDLANNSFEVHQRSAEPWKVTVVDTGEKTFTGGRIKRVAEYIGDEDFCCTYGDGLGDINIRNLLQFHKQHGGLATVTATQPPGRFGVMSLSGTKVHSFQEKPEQGGGLVNGGFFVLSPKTLNYIAGDETIWEREPLENLAKDGAMYAYHHEGFWQPMDTLRDKMLLEQLWNEGKAAWKIWD
ncbi:MAG: glucose-1-phosphate cytidylyltransferase [Bdellovibrionales bacterium]|nr:glucose-1-phosphate cytidylyltransferase [Bdellovibrionales bacterium]